MNYIINHSTLLTSLVSFWEMQELSGTRYDAHSTNHLTANGTGGVAQAAGKVGWAADFEDGDSDYLEITDGSQSGLDLSTDWSFSAWVYFEALPTSGNLMTIASKGVNGGGNGQYAMQIYNDTGTYRLRVTVYDSTNPGDNLTINIGVVTPSTATWYHYVWTFTESTFTSQGFVNGSSLGAGVVHTGYDGTMNNSTGPFAIGRLATSNTSYWDGRIDQLGVWSKVLSGSEITDLYNSGSGMGYGVAVDATAEGYANASSLTYSHTCTGDDKYLIVDWYEFTNARTVTSVTYAGVNMTLLKEQSADGGGGMVRQYGLVAPAAGANNIVITLSGANQIFATSVSYNGVSQSAPNPDTNISGSTASSTSHTSSAITLSVANSWVALVGRSPSNAPVATSTSFVRKQNGTSGDAGWTLDSNKFRASGSNTLSWTTSGSCITYYAFSSIAPVGAGGASGPANLKSYNTNLKANIKSINTNPIANIKSLNTNV